MYLINFRKKSTHNKTVIFFIVYIVTIYTAYSTVKPWPINYYTDTKTPK